jgi:hypothetical protein
MSERVVEGAQHLNEIDLCLVVDTTGSMGPFIQAAKRELHGALGALEEHGGADLRVGLVQYRDHPPQDRSFVTRVDAMTGDLGAARGYVAALELGGGGDEPEAVLRGVHDACTRTQWRPHALRFAVLVGDAPPHAYRAWEQAPRGAQARVHDGFPTACPSGLDVRAVTAAAETNRVVVHAVCMTEKWITMASFKDLSVPTGGTCTHASAAQAVAAITALLEAELARVPLDRRVLAAFTQAPEAGVDALARALDEAPSAVAESLGRLGRRALV